MMIEANNVSNTEPTTNFLFISLPFEIVCKIAGYLRPRRHSSVHPHPKAQTLDVSAIVVPARGAIKDLLFFAYASKTCYIAALPTLYHAIALQSTRQARLLAQSLTVPYQIKPTDFDEYSQARQPRHLFLPNDGLLAGSSDHLVDQYKWAPSIRTLFRYSHTLDSIFLGSRSDGALLSEFLDDEVRARPRRATILNYYASPPFSMWNLSPFSQLTHLHLIGLIPRNAILQLLSGESSYTDGPHTITHLRLSQLHPETLHGFGEYIKWRRSFDAWDALPQLERNRNGVQPPERPRVPARMFEAQETLFTLAVQVGKMPYFRRLLLELGELAPLPVPEHIPLLEGDVGSAIEDHTGEEGRLTTTHHPTGLPASLDEAHVLADEAERSRTAHRDLYWIDTRDGKEALQALFTESRQQAVQIRRAEEGAEEGKGPMTTSRSLQMPVEVRVVVPRPGGWDSNECRADFEAQVEACSYQSRRSISSLRSSAPHASPKTTLLTAQEQDDDGDDDGTCFSDPDLFYLAEKRPWLSYDGSRCPDWTAAQQVQRTANPIPQRMTGGSETVPAGTRSQQDWRDPKRTWWTGSLPRYDASASARSGSPAAIASVG